MGFFQDLFGDTAADAANTAAQQKIAGLKSAQAYADPQYDAARGAITSGYGGAINTFTPGYNLGVSGAGAYGDITGANGVVGQDRARALFQTDPGYEFALAQGLQATERQRGTGGFQGSGNVLTALTDYASGKAAQQYSDYVNRLLPFLNYSTTTAGQLGGAQTGQGTAQAGLDVNQANLGYGTQAGIGSAQAAGTLGAAQARTAAAGNIANLGTKLLGYALGGPIGGNLFGGSGGEFGISDDELYGVGARALQA